MGRDDVARSELEQATLRVRLVATALGATLLMLAPSLDQAAAAAVLVAYLAVSLALRAFGARLVTGIPAILGSASDILFAGALSVVLPGSPAWPLYAFAIGAAALRHGQIGAAAATAAAIVVYDAVLIARGGGALAADLWPVQVLLGFGLLAAELVWIGLREQRGHTRSRAYALAQRDCAAAADQQQLLDRVADHAVRTFGARGAAIELERDGVRRVLVSRGDPSADGQAGRHEIDLAADTFLCARFAASDATIGVATLSDLAGDVSPLLAAARDRERLIADHDTLIATATELRVRSEDLERQLRDREDAVASAVHEIRNPLASVRAYGQLMSRHLGSVQRQVLQLDALIEDLLHLPAGSSPRPLALETVDLSREAAEAAARIRVTQPDTAIRVVTDLSAGPFAARIDAIRFEQVMDNILGNAVKFSPSGARIEVRVERRLDDVVVAVSDRGDGILPEDLERIFARHTRASRHADTVPGAGIGLAIASEIVLAHGGRMWAESAGPGRGSTITIALPVVETTAPVVPVPEGASTV